MRPLPTANCHGSLYRVPAEYGWQVGGFDCGVRIWKDSGDVLAEMTRDIKVRSVQCQNVLLSTVRGAGRQDKMPGQVASSGRLAGQWSPQSLPGTLPTPDGDLVLVMVPERCDGGPGLPGQGRRWRETGRRGPQLPQCLLSLHALAVAAILL